MHSLALPVIPWLAAKLFATSLSGSAPVVVGAPGSEDAIADIGIVTEQVSKAAPELSIGEPTWDLPNLDHERVDTFVEMFTGRKRDEFAGFLARSGRYRPMISRKLAERDMPQDLLYLAMIESGFRTEATSRAAAVGLWQFIPETGKRYGLDINRAVDERRDPERATDAALDYLQELHDRFDSWYLAAAAYNTGENRVARIMREETGSERARSEEAYYEIWHRLPRETRDYVPLMIAAARIAKEPHKYGFEDVEYEQPDRVDTLTLDPGTPLEVVARATRTSVQELRRLNPHLKLDRIREDRSDTIRVPEGTALRAAYVLALR